MGMSKARSLSQILIHGSQSTSLGSQQIKPMEIKHDRSTEATSKSAKASMIDLLLLSMIFSSCLWWQGNFVRSTRLTLQPIVQESDFGWYVPALDSLNPAKVYQWHRDVSRIGHDYGLLFPAYEEILRSCTFSTIEWNAATTVSAALMWCCSQQPHHVVSTRACQRVSVHCQAQTLVQCNCSTKVFLAFEVLALQLELLSSTVQTLDNPYYELIGYSIYLCHGRWTDCHITATSSDSPLLRLSAVKPFRTAKG